MAEREGVSNLKVLSSTKLFFHLYPTITTEDFPDCVRDERERFSEAGEKHQKLPLQPIIKLLL